MTNEAANQPDADELNEQYHQHKTALAQLRAQATNDCVPPADRVKERIRALAPRADGHLLVFLANDFGFPAAYRPEGTPRTIQNDVREAILEDKYDASHNDLDTIRTDLVALHRGIHKAIVAEHDGNAVRYHLPEGSTDETNFLTVREMVGLVDYTTNSAQAASLSQTY